MSTGIRDDRGSVSVEAALWLVPALIVVLGLVQLALWWAVVDTCSAAAQQGLDTGRVLGATPADATQQATGYLARATGLAHDPRVSTAGTTDTVMRISVSAEVTMVVPIPGLSWHVERAAVGAREHRTNPWGTA